MACAFDQSQAYSTEGHVDLSKTALRALTVDIRISTNIGTAVGKCVRFINFKFNNFGLNPSLAINGLHGNSF